MSNYLKSQLLLYQADVVVPLSVLLDHIEEREPADAVQSGLSLYLAQKDIREHLPWLGLSPSKLPLLVSPPAQYPSNPRHSKHVCIQLLCII